MINNGFMTIQFYYKRFKFKKNKIEILYDN